ncbi:MAG: hypothetical protein WBW33_37375 [Bryobacteraceae bacterium]
MNIRKRLEALEKGILREPETLTMPDGRTETIVAHGCYLLRLFLAAIGKEPLSPKQAANLELIRRSTGGNPMIDLIRCFLQGPVGVYEEAAAQQK